MYLPPLLAASLPSVDPHASVTLGTEAAAYQCRLLPTGQVSAVELLQGANGVGSPWIQSLGQHIESWRFGGMRIGPMGLPASPASSGVLVAALIRPPALYLNQTISSPTPVHRDRRWPEVPFASRIVVPEFPIRAQFGGATLMEIAINPLGAVIDARLRLIGEGFQDVSLVAARQWSFEPARIAGRPVASRAFIVYVFPTPL
jgi:hypothetical protein